MEKEIFTYLKGKGRKLAEISFLAENKPGILYKLSKVLADNKINILSGFLTVQPLSEYGVAAFFVDYTEVGNEDELNRIIEELKAVDSILSVDLRLSADPGIIFDEITFPIIIRGRRMVPVSADYITLAFKRLYDIFKDAAAVVIYEIGEAYGEDAVNWALEEFEEFKFSLERILRLIAKYARAVGWCKMSILEYNEEEGKITFKIEDNFECEAFRGAKKPMGHFLRGVISGFLSGLFGRRWFVREIRCIAKGDEACVFYASKDPFI